MKIQLTQLAIDNSIDIAVADDFVPLVAVCSYPRSGTHFVINSIVKNLRNWIPSNQLSSYDFRTWEEAGEFLKTEAK